MNRNIVNSIGLLMILSWFNRLLGLVSIFLLARFLTPEAFGLAAIVFIAVNFVDALSNIGAEQYVIQKEDATLQDLRLAWSLNLVFKGGISIILLSVSSVIDSFYPEHHILWPLVAVSFIPLITALSNGQIYWLKKQLQLSNHVKCAALSKLMANCVSIAVAFIYQSYWALIVGAIISALGYTLLSYIIIAQRIGFTLSNWRSQYDFSKWVFFRTGVGHSRAKLDIWVAAVYFPASALGVYNLAREVALLPCREILTPIAEVFYSAIGNQKNHTEAQFRQIQSLLGITYMLAVPIAIGWGLIAEDFVYLVLGQQWVSSTETLTILGWLVLTYAVGFVNNQVFTALGRVRSLFYYDLVTLATSAVILVGGIQWFNDSINQLAWLRVGAEVIIVIIGTFWLGQILKVSVLTLLAPLPYLLTAAGVMAWIAGTVSMTEHTLLNLIMTLFISVLVYSVAVAIGCKFRLMGKYTSEVTGKFFSDVIGMISSKINNRTGRIG